MSEEKKTSYYPGSIEAVYGLLDPCDRENADIIDSVLEAAEEAGLKEAYTGDTQNVQARLIELRAIVEAEYARRRNTDT